MNGIKKETWMEVEKPRDRDSLLFDMLEGIDQSINKKFEAGEERFAAAEKNHSDLATRFDRRKKWDTAAAAGGGVIGGALVMFGTVITKLMGWLK